MKKKEKEKTILNKMSYTLMLIWHQFISQPFYGHFFANEIAEFSSRVSWYTRNIKKCTQWIKQNKYGKEKLIQKHKNKCDEH